MFGNEVTLRPLKGSFASNFQGWKNVSWGGKKLFKKTPPSGDLGYNIILLDH